MPREQGVRLEEEDDLGEVGTSRVRHDTQFVGEDDQGELLPAGNVGRVRLCALEDAQLLPQQQDLDILGMIGLTTQPDEVEQQREDVCEQNEDHDEGSCRDCAEQRVRSPNLMTLSSLSETMAASDAFFAH